MAHDELGLLGENAFMSHSIDLTAEEAGRPGALGRIAGKVATAGINISVAYLATRDRAVLVTSDNEKAREALQT